jgi:hypothetical protein
MSAPAEIYGLFCPRTGALRYIGMARNAEKRLRQHLRDCITRDSPVYLWIRGLLAEELAPRMEVLQRSLDGPGAERAAIAEARAAGHDLLNLTRGGDQPVCSIDVRAMNGRANARAIHDDPRRRRLWALKKDLGKALKAGVVSDQAKAKMRALARANPTLFGQWANIPEGDEVNTNARRRAREETQP